MSEEVVYGLRHEASKPPILGPVSAEEHYALRAQLRDAMHMLACATLQAGGRLEIRMETYFKLPMTAALIRQQTHDNGAVVFTLADQDAAGAEYPNPGRDRT